MNQPTNTEITYRTQTLIPEVPTTRSTKPVRVVALPARFDAFAAVELKIEDDTNLVVDARAVRFADLHALQSLVDARLESLDAGSDMVIAAPSYELRAILELTEFGDLLNVLAPEQTNNLVKSAAQLTLSGDLGPEHIEALETELAQMLDRPRPRVEIDLVEVGSLHLGIVNVLVAARSQAQAQAGDIKVIVGTDSEVQHLLSQVGIVGTIRP